MKEYVLDNFYRVRHIAVNRVSAGEVYLLI